MTQPQVTEYRGYEIHVGRFNTTVWAPATGWSYPGQVVKDGLSGEGAAIDWIDAFYAVEAEMIAAARKRR